ncbi:hypothetical protein HBZC1_14050 [Helicobacter bizzozeronii CIII-1]|uniref:Uncharacterized protein n=1 Tax=Helicobacter bizzozeronii (strain CIII-1) TaxID=1002804 RepID=F8KU52_HELBC|nr:hypothetical protein HBZC1_14050 [Helicobacter bizzozeronii CIII-1]
MDAPTSYITPTKAALCSACKPPTKAPIPKTQFKKRLEHMQNPQSFLQIEQLG